MSKPTRAYIESACHHIMARGNQKQAVFLKTEDYKVYLNIVGKAKKRYKGMLYAYCLMPNHVHLLMEFTPVRNISKFMHWVNRGYATYFNEEYKKVGHLWQGRFKSSPIIKGEYLLNCVNYIETNPIRAGIVNEPSEYFWSSYGERCLLLGGGILDNMLIQ